MKDFTLEAYQAYLDCLLGCQANIITFRDYFESSIGYKSFVIIRHDVDRLSDRSLRMARLEEKKGVRTSYYFRNRTFNPLIAKEIQSLGHEVGYHYECLSDAKGDIDLAWKIFNQNLDKMRAHVDIKTASMHGRPLSRHDNRSMFGDSQSTLEFLGKAGLFGEVYLSINYSDIVYLCDTGRNWSSDKNNLRDRVVSNMIVNIHSKHDVIGLLSQANKLKLIFQIHPERWTSGLSELVFQVAIDSSVNAAKRVVKFFR